MSNYLNKKTLDRCVKLALIRGRCIRILQEVEAVKQEAEKIRITERFNG